MSYQEIKNDMTDCAYCVLMSDRSYLGNTPDVEMPERCLSYRAMWTARALQSIKNL